ncbi:hypothetical protein C9E81_00170 [Paracoccus alkanivorans]|uniref:Transposase IS66 C-terminal domain-containing protein n=1 Tax=Paracoccus alkanivorans TaxID=2116655 RepID=A0A3M0MHU8_9RHOB|nr:transposase domain-containing protein [Paracoccus alkanivorans]RMC37221.1 hypothetical protein C9E81_00170 [Paracoccus alkanivorans]
MMKCYEIDETGTRCPVPVGAASHRQDGVSGSGRNGEVLQMEMSHNVDPAAWLTQTLQRIANQWPSSNI